MQSYYGGRSETRIRCAEVPVVPVDFTSEYPTCCALLGLFDVLTAKNGERYLNPILPAWVGRGKLVG